MGEGLALCMQCNNWLAACDLVLLLLLRVKIGFPAAFRLRPASPGCAVQADALAIGKNSQALRAEGVPEHLIPHKTFSGGCAVLVWGLHTRAALGLLICCASPSRRTPAVQPASSC